MCICICTHLHMHTNILGGDTCMHMCICVSMPIAHVCDYKEQPQILSSEMLSTSFETGSLTGRELDN